MGAVAPYISVAVTAAGAIASAAGQMQQASASSASSRYQAQVAENNRIIAERKAQDALERGKEAEAQSRIRTNQLKARQRAMLAANGVVVDQDSALDITMDTAALGEMDALTIRSNAEREAAGFRSEGMNYQAQADLSKASAQNARSQGRWGVAGSVLEGAGSVANKWYTLNREGAFNSKKSTFNYEMT